MALVAQDQIALLPDVLLLEAGPQGAGQVAGGVPGVLRGAQPGQGDAEQVLAGLPELIEGVGPRQGGQGAVPPPGEGQHQAGVAEVLHPGQEGVGLDLEDLPAAGGQGGRVLGHEGVAVDAAPQGTEARGLVGGEGEQAVGRGGAGVVGGAVPEGAELGPGVEQPFQVDVGQEELGLTGEALRFGQQVPVLVDQGVGVVGHVRRRLARSGAGVDEGADAGAGGLPAQLVAVLAPAEPEGAPGEVADHGGPGAGQEGVGGQLHPGVLADLDPHHQAGDVLRPEEEVRPEGHGLPRHLHRHSW